VQGHHSIPHPTGSLHKLSLKPPIDRRLQITFLQISG